MLAERGGVSGGREGGDREFIPRLFHHHHSDSVLRQTGL